MHQRISLTRQGSNAQSTRLGCWFVDQGSARRGCCHRIGRHKWTESSLEESTYRGSSTSHHTPMPAADPSCPFPEHAPSVYTTICDSVPDSRRDWLESPGLTVDEDKDAGIGPLGSESIEVLASPGEWFSGLIFCFTEYGTARCIQDSASSRVLSFLYLAQG